MFLSVVKLFPTVIETLGYCFNNFWHFAIFSILLLFLFGRATIKLKHNIFAKTIDRSLILLIPLYAAGSDSTSPPAPFSFHRQLMVVVLVRCAGF